MHRRSLFPITALWLCAVAGATPAATTEPTCSSAKNFESLFMWNATATNAQCEPYIPKTANVYQLRDIVWPCFASGCTARMAAVANVLPDCAAPGQTMSLKTKVRAVVNSCSSARGSGSGSGSSEDTGGSRGAITATTALAIRRDSSSGSDSGGGSSGGSTSGSGYSMESCTTSEIKTTTDEFLKVATGAECKPYAVVGSYIISVFAPCKSRCVTTKYESLAAAVPNCFMSYYDELRNKKEHLMLALRNCSRANTSTANVMSLYIKLETSNRIDITKSGSSSSSAYSPTKSSAAPRSDLASRLSTTGLLMAVAMASFTIVRLS